MLLKEPEPPNLPEPARYYPVIVEERRRYVVWVEADAEVRIDAESSSRPILPIAESPNSS